MLEEGIESLPSQGGCCRLEKGSCTYPPSDMLNLNLLSHQEDYCGRRASCQASGLFSQFTQCFRPESEIASLVSRCDHHVSIIDRPGRWWCQLTAGDKAFS